MVITQRTKWLSDPSVLVPSHLGVGLTLFLIIWLAGKWSLVSFFISFAASIILLGGLGLITYLFRRGNGFELRDDGIRVMHHWNFTDVGWADIKLIVFYSGPPHPFLVQPLAVYAPHLDIEHVSLGRMSSKEILLTAKARDHAESMLRAIAERHRLHLEIRSCPVAYAYGYAPAWR